MVLVTLDIVQHEYLAGTVRQFLQRRFEIDGHVARTRRRSQRVENGLSVVQALPAAGIGAEALDDDVHRQPVQPGAERRVTAERAQFLPDPYEHVLGDFVAIVPAGHPSNEAVDSREMRAVELLERADVSRGGLLDIVSLRVRPGRAFALLAFGPRQ
jgi:hypothetical protein